jgi:hypothetical protein
VAIVAILVSSSLETTGISQIASLTKRLNSIHLLLKNNLFCKKNTTNHFPIRDKFNKVAILSV